ncbi:signal recognition particle subunit SRP72-like [Pecten maximus]|uniref:signal recognition particle subunit SRP72-like n=1 Tax=Pecten maximus TaxID=6579 RepID=UPI0014590216|nr:signal recognition particle subunit SRP72-like [Pecten maximus]
MAQAPQSIPALYAELKKFGQNQEFERALKFANKILQEDAGESAAFHCKIVCLSKLDKFDEALTALHKGKAHASGLKFEKAYCEYRLNRTMEALTTLRSVEKPDNRTNELLAQVLYRMENYEECYQLYRNLIQNSEDEYDEERETNLSAVLASCQLWDEVDMDDPGLQEESYEMCYNMACYLIGRKDFKGAEKKLRKAEVYCRKMFEDDTEVTEEEIEDELAIIRVQLAFVLQKLQRTEEALSIYNQVMKHKPSDAGISAVASNNIVTLNKDQNVFDSKKKMKSATSDNLKHKLTTRQRQSININQCLLHLHTNQAEQCHTLAARLKTQFPDLSTPVLVDAAQYVKDKDYKRAIQLMQDYAKVHPEQSVKIHLASAQIHLVHGEVYQACDDLKSLGDLQYRPGVVSALVTLYVSQEDNDSASDVLDRTVKWYQKHQANSADHLLMTRANANFQLKNGNPQQAAAMLEDLRRSQPDDPHTLAQLISAYSQFDSEKAQFISRDLPSVKTLAKNVDVDAVEAAFSTLGPKYMKRAQKTDTQPSPGPSGDMIIQKARRKKKKKGKLPKNLDAEQDSERWLPRRERSYYRGKRKDKKKDIGKGTQGSATLPSGDMDASKGGSGSEASSPRPGSAPSPMASAAAAALPQGPRQQKPAQAQKKKKKKGSKW